MTISTDRALKLLTDLIAIDSINPMGAPFTRVTPLERQVCDYVEEFLTPYGVKLERDAFSDRHENLLAIVPGTEPGPSILFEAHADTVPADDWIDRALQPRVEGGRVYGRGASDDKGSLVAMLLALVDIIERGEQPRHQVLLMAAGDEEYAQTGIKRFRELGQFDVGWGVFGEPSSLVPIVQHKGTVRWDITVHGRSAHTSRPHLGVNAIHGAIEVIGAIAEHERQLATTHDNALMTPSTLTVTMITGGRTRNAVPDECTIAVDYRVVPGRDPATARQDVIDDLARLEWQISHSDVQLMTPPLATRSEDPFSRWVLEVCRRHGDPAAELAGVPYGTDASWVSDIAPAIVLGPGSIDTAHAVDEYVDIDEVVACAHIYRELMLGAELIRG